MKHVVLKSSVGKLRVYLKHSFDRIKNEKLKNNMLQAIPFWIASIITGLIAVVYTKLFLLAERLTLYVYHQSAWLLWWLVNRFAPYSKGSGIP